MEYFFFKDVISVNKINVILVITQWSHYNSLKIEHITKKFNYVRLMSDKNTKKLFTFDIYITLILKYCSLPDCL